jgi:hypothetical protein
VTLKAFLFLLVVTIVAVTGGALIAEMLLPPGFERGIVIAVLSGLVVFPAARWAEYRGWIQGAWSPGGEARRQRDAQAALRAEAGSDSAVPATPPVPAASAVSPASAMSASADAASAGASANSALPADAGQHREAPAPAGAGPDRRSEEPQQPSAGQTPSALPAGDFKPPGEPR